MPNDIRASFAKKLRNLMNERRLSQQDLVRDLKIPSTTVCEWHNGKSYPRPEKMQRLADYFGVPVASLTGTDEASVTAIAPTQSEVMMIERWRKLSDRDKLMISHMIDSVLWEYEQRREKAVSGSYGAEEQESVELGQDIVHGGV